MAKSKKKENKGFYKCKVYKREGSLSIIRERKNKKEMKGTYQGIVEQEVFMIKVR